KRTTARSPSRIERTRAAARRGFASRSSRDANDLHAPAFVMRAEPGDGGICLGQRPGFTGRAAVRQDFRMDRIHRILTVPFQKYLPSLSERTETGGPGS